MAAPTAPKVRKLDYIRFHLGIQFMGSKIQGAPTMYLDVDSHKKHDLEMWALPNGRAEIHIGDVEFLVPDSVTHFMKCSKE